MIVHKNVQAAIRVDVAERLLDDLTYYLNETMYNLNRGKCVIAPLYEVIENGREPSHDTPPIPSRLI